MFGLKQLIEIPTRITCSSSSIYHLSSPLASFSNRVIQRGILNVRLSDHQLIYFTRKITRTKRGGTNRYTIKFVYDYYKKFSLSENFKLESTTEDYLFRLLKNVEVKKEAGVDQTLGKCLKDRGRILAKPMRELCIFFLDIRKFSRYL